MANRADMSGRGLSSARRQVAKKQRSGTSAANTGRAQERLEARSAMVTMASSWNMLNATVAVFSPGIRFLPQGFNFLMPDTRDASGLVSVGSRKPLPLYQEDEPEPKKPVAREVSADDLRAFEQAQQPVGKGGQRERPERVECHPPAEDEPLRRSVTRRIDVPMGDE